MTDCARRPTFPPARMIRTIEIAALILLASFSWVAPVARAEEATPLKLVAADATGVTLEYTAPEPRFTPTETPFGNFDRIEMDGHGTSGFLGQPSLPETGTGIGVPEGAEPRLTFEILESIELTGHRPLPMGDAPTAPGSTPTRVDRSAFDAAAYEPGNEPVREPIAYAELGQLRHQRIGQVSVRPLRLHDGDQLTWIRRARIRVDFRMPSRAANAATLPVGVEPAWEEAYRGAMINYESARSFRSRPMPNPAGRGGDRSLLESTDAAIDLARAIDGNPEMRLFVAKTGLYYLSFADLSAKGWPDNVAIGQVSFFEKSYNAADPANPLIRDIPVTIEEGTTGTPGIFDGDDTIYLYVMNFADRTQATPQFTRFSNLQAYWLSWRAAGGSRMTSDPGWFESASVTTPSSYVMETHYEQNPYYLTDRVEEESYQGNETFHPKIEGYFWLEGIVYRDSLQFQTPGRDATRPYRFRARWQGLFAGNHHAKVWQKTGCGANAPDTLIGRTPPYMNIVNRGGFCSGCAYIMDTGYRVPGARLNDGCNEIRLQGNGVANGDTTSEGSGAYFDWFEVDYPRRYVASGGTLRFTSSNATGDVEFVISDLRESDIRVFDITDSLAPRLVAIDPSKIVQTQGAPNRRWQATMRVRVTGGQRTYVLWEYSQIPNVSTSVANGRMPKDQGTTNLALDTPDQLTTDTGANVLVICHPDFRTTFEPWKALREGQGNRLRFVSPQDIYDQFSGGVKTPYAIRLWLRYVYQNWTVAPDDVVLIGDASEDYRSDVTGNPKFKSDPDWVPTMMIYGPVPNGAGRREKIGTDHWYIGSLGPGQGEFDMLPEMYIGRISVNSTTDAQIMVDKLVAYDNYTANDTWRNRGLIVSDDQFSSPLAGFNDYRYQPTELIFEEVGDSLAHIYNGLSCYNGFEATHWRLDDYLTALNRPKPPCPPNNPTCQGNALAAQAEARRTATPAWVEESSKGHLFQIYSGHANAAVMATELFVEFRGDRLSPDARITEQLTNYGKPFIFFGVACHLNEFESYNEGNTKMCLSESMLFLANRGAIASIASTGFEWLYSNEGVELYLGKVMFAEHPRDPLTGRPRRILAESMYAALIRLITERPNDGFLYNDTIRSYGLLGDPTMRIDMAPPILAVTVDGAPVEPNTAVRAAPGADAVTVQVKVADDVDDKADSFAITAGETAVPSSEWTSTPFQTSDLGACHGVRIDWPATLEPANYTINLTGTDWLGRTMSFPLRVEVTTEYRVGGRPLAMDELLPTDVGLEARVLLPVGIAPGEVDIRVNGEAGYFAWGQGADTREWIGMTTRALPAGEVTLETQVREVSTGTFRIRTQTEFGLDAIYFYPSPWSGVGPAYFTYQLSFLEGNAPRRAEVSVFSISGRKVTTLVGTTTVGRNTLEWNGTDQKGDPIANGVYLYKLNIEDADGHQHATIDRLVVHR
ncbi:MAG TPA: C25 family cysteine peptidase [Candidatus Eisenbacteria bacterium]